MIIRDHHAGTCVVEFDHISADKIADNWKLGSIRKLKTLFE